MRFRLSVRLAELERDLGRRDAFERLDEHLGPRDHEPTRLTQPLAAGDTGTGLARDERLAA